MVVSWKGWTVRSHEAGLYWSNTYFFLPIFHATFSLPNAAYSKGNGHPLDSNSGLCPPASFNHCVAVQHITHLINCISRSSASVKRNLTRMFVDQLKSFKKKNVEKKSLHGFCSLCRIFFYFKELRIFSLPPS